MMKPHLYLAYQSAGITGVNHHAQAELPVFVFCFFETEFALVAQAGV